MDSEHIKTQYLSLSMFGVLPTQHILLKGESHDDLLVSPDIQPIWIFSSLLLEQYILFHLSFTAFLLHDRVDLCKDHLSLHGITISLHAGIS